MLKVSLLTVIVTIVCSVQLAKNGMNVHGLNVSF